MKRHILFFMPVVLGVCLLGSCKNQKAPEQAEETGAFASQSIPSVADGSIVYVELDSLTANYQMTIDLSAELEEKMKKMDTDLTNRQRTFQNNVNDFRNKYEKGLETRARLAEMEQSLATEEQNLMQLAERYRMELGEEQMVMQRKVLQALMDYLKEYNRDKGYQFIMGRAFGDNMLFAAPGLDITASVLEGINAKYKTEKK